MSEDLLGIVCCGISALFFGSMFVPVKNHETGNGIFFQWVMSCAIMMVAYIVFAIRGFPGFYPIAMLGGVFWTIGNSTAVPIINRIGMAIGILIWNTTNCLSGWASGRFGLFGMNSNIPSYPILNYCGLLLVLIGGVVFTFVEGSSDKDEKTGEQKQINDTELALIDSNKPEISPPGEAEQHKNSSDRIVGILLAIGAGFFYGITFVPVNYMVDNKETFVNYPVDGLDYVFSHFSGIFMSATTIMLVYTIIMKNSPFINKSLILPSFSSGLLWAIAQCAFFVANQKLSQTITFPIITMMPGCIASIWSIFYFKEITEKKDIITIILGISVTLVGVVIVALSK